MTKWRIIPSGVVSSLSAVERSASDLVAAAQPIAGLSEEVIVGCADLSSVASELMTVLDRQLGDLRSADTRIIAGVLGAHGATTAYVRGDEEMAASTHRAAIDAASSGDLSFFGISS